MSRDRVIQAAGGFLNVLVEYSSISMPAANTVPKTRIGRLNNGNQAQLAG